MKTLIKEIFQGKFKKQVENITNLINGNFKLTMQEIHGLKKGNQWPKKKTWVYTKQLSGKGWQRSKKGKATE